LLAAHCFSIDLPRAVSMPARTIATTDAARLLLIWSRNALIPPSHKDRYRATTHKLADKKKPLMNRASRKDTFRKVSSLLLESLVVRDLAPRKTSRNWDSLLAKMNSQNRAKNRTRPQMLISSLERMINPSTVSKTIARIGERNRSKSHLDVFISCM